jgi:hypothetical protein
VGALAIGDHRANAVGPVRLVCERDGLRVELLRVGRFASGFAFATLADAVSFRVPYRAVRGMVRDGRSLLLSLDPRAAAPYTRFALTRFCRAPSGALMRAFRVRRVASALSYLLPVPLALLAAGELHARAGASPALIALGALVVAAAALWLARTAVGWLSWGGPISDRLRDRFEQALSAELGLVPAPELEPLPLPPVVTPLPAPPARPAPAPPRLAPAPVRAPARAEAPEPRPREVLAAAFRPWAFAAVAAAAAGAAVLASFAVRRYGVAEAVVLPVAQARTGLGASLPDLGRVGVAAAQTSHPSCRCERVDSALWREGMPQLSIVVSPVKGGIDALWLEPGKTYPVGFGPGERPRVELDLAVVNNGKATMRELNLVLTFAERTPTGERIKPRERGLYWGSRLRPGESVKWRVKAPGTELKIDTRHDAPLAAVGAADAEAFYGLSQARLPAVRLHGAVMLAMLGDPRYAALAQAAGELPPAGEAIKAELARLGAPLALCDAEPIDAGLEACLWNGSTALERALVVVEIARDGSEKRHVVRDFFHPGEGLRVSLPIDASAAALRVERE